MPALLRHTLIRLLLPCCLAMAVAACSFPGVYHLTVQQGNVVSQDMVNQLQPGMDKRQIRYIMGTPLLIDSFEDNRWDYFYSLKNGDNEYSRERLTLYFSNDILTNLQGNFRPEQATGATVLRDGEEITPSEEDDDSEWDISKWWD
ncbi:MAG: outer membrane protein assembly factor BamE [Pseudomonadales bacterium]